MRLRKIRIFSKIVLIIMTFCLIGGNMVYAGELSESLDSFSYFDTILFGIGPFSHLSEWGQEHMYQLRWTLLENGNRKANTGDALMLQKEFSDILLDYILEYYPIEKLDEDEKIELLNNLGNLSDNDIWKQVTEERNPLDWDKVIDEKNTIDDEKSQDVEARVLAGVDTILGLYALEVNASSILMEAEEASNSSVDDVEKAFEQYRALKLVEYKGIAEFYNHNTPEGRYIENQIQVLYNMSVNDPTKAEKYDARAWLEPGETESMTETEKPKGPMIISLNDESKSSDNTVD